MNFLAHLYLSGEHTEVLIGNFMADSVKGKAAESYPPGIRAGIRLHRFIDSYTDSHPQVTLMKDLLRPHMGKFAPVVADVFLDHFLAAGWLTHHTEPLPAYAQNVYTFLQHHSHLLPPRTAAMLPYMVKHNWLLAYASTAGTAHILAQMSRRTIHQNQMHSTESLLLQHYEAFSNQFTLFFEDIKEKAAVFRQQV